MKGFLGLCCVVKVLADEVFVVCEGFPNLKVILLLSSPVWLMDGGMRWIIQPQETKNTTFAVCTQWIILSMRCLKPRDSQKKEDTEVEQRRAGDAERVKEKQGVIKWNWQRWFGIQVLRWTIDYPAELLE